MITLLCSQNPLNSFIISVQNKTQKWQNETKVAIRIARNDTKSYRPGKDAFWQQKTPSIHSPFPRVPAARPFKIYWKTCSAGKETIDVQNNLPSTHLPYLLHRHKKNLITQEFTLDCGANELLVCPLGRAAILTKWLENANEGIWSRRCAQPPWVGFVSMWVRVPFFFAD